MGVTQAGPNQIDAMFEGGYPKQLHTYNLVVWQPSLTAMHGWITSPICWKRPKHRQLLWLYSKSDCSPTDNIFLLFWNGSHILRSKQDYFLKTDKLIITLPPPPPPAPFSDLDHVYSYTWGFLFYCEWSTSHKIIFMFRFYKGHHHYRDEKTWFSDLSLFLPYSWRWRLLESHLFGRISAKWYTLQDVVTPLKGI